MALKSIMVLFRKFQKWKSEKSYMEKFTGQRQQLNYFCLYEQRILNIYKVLVLLFLSLIYTFLDLNVNLKELVLL